MVRIPKKLNYKYLLLGIAAILIADIVLGLVHHKPKLATIPSVSPTDKTSSQSLSPDNTSNNNPSGSSNGTSSSEKSVSSGAAQVLTLSAAQTLVSNHHPGENGSPSTEQSACQTTPGATCYIEFTQNGLTRKLDAKTADNNGLVVWDWDIKDAGLSSGQWEIIAVASLNGQVKTSSDPSPLEIQ